MSSNKIFFQTSIYTLINNFKIELLLTTLYGSDVQIYTNPDTPVILLERPFEHI